MRTGTSLYIIFGLLFVIASGVATASSPDGVAPAIDKDLCQYLARHVPGDDVAYEPGVDVNGKPVVEADAGDASPLALPEKTEFTLTVDIAKYLGLNVPAGLAGEAAIGSVALDEGDILFNGEAMSGKMQSELVALCSKQTDKATETGK